ncbi:naphthalene 1,2-dioxygenase system ferredoxin subunit [Paraburkholderia sp. BL23I1N1]|nr:naphthalene 1,2-dioxygenase system ferredoxin subunit [Paraburkholderia sp. BL23I1N1]
MPKWIKLIEVADIPQNGVVAVEADSQGFAVFSVDHKMCVTDNICTHGRTRFCDGYPDIHAIECPSFMSFYEGGFNGRDGNALCEPLTDDLRIRPTNVKGETLFVAAG